MGKYDPLKRHLKNRSDDCVELSFSELEQILGFPLPKSAYRHQAWWANESHGSHSHARSWQDAGWQTRRVSTSAATVRFERRDDPVKTMAAPPKRPDLWEQARAMSGIEDREELIDAALLALIQREAGRRLIEMGGTMPGAKAAPRERPFG